MSITRSIASPDGPIRPARLALVVIDGPDAGRRLELEQGTYVVGKDLACHLVLSDRTVSRRHLELRVEMDGVRIRDLDSKNGTFLDGVRVSEVVVGAGAVVKLAQTTLKVTSPTDDARLEPSASTTFGSLYGASMAMREAFAILERVAGADVPVLIEGETGTGKELCAEAIHAHSGRSGGPFAVCDVTGLPRGLIESELFGHVRGAFTGADRDRQGVIASADGGTLFIDEIGELDLESQPRLLRAIERRELKPIGASGYRRVDVRLVAATNRDLQKEVAAGRFREDLYHRLAVVKVRLPPLRQRRSDIPELVQRFLGERKLRVPPEALAVLNEYSWPGNVRELKNVVERSLALARNGAELTPALLGLDTAAGREELPWPKVDQPDFFDAKERLISAWERQYLKELLERCEHNVSRAARESGIGRNYLHRLLKKHGLQGGDAG